MQPPRKSENELILGLVSISDRASKGIYDDRGIPELEAWCRKAITNPLTASSACALSCGIPTIFGIARCSGPLLTVTAIALPGIA